MNATTVGVDLAKNCFELAVADAQHRVQRRERLSRRQFERFFGNLPASRIVMEIVWFSASLGAHAAPART